MTLSLNTVGTTIYEFFTKKKVEVTARQTKFVQRHSTLDGLTFLQASVFGFIDDPQANLDDLAGICADLGVEITVQGFDQRINQAAVAFLKAMLNQAVAQFKHTVALPVPLLHQFSAVNLLDSTSLSLPAGMIEEYPGCGGDGPEASLKIHLNFEFLYGNLSQMVLRPGREPDQQFESYLDWVQPGSLNLKDLGYFCLDNLQTLAETKQAYYISRLLPGVGLTTATGQPFNLYPWLKKQPRQPLELAVGLGVEHHLPARLIAIPLPQAVAERRRQRAKENARRKGRTLTQEYLNSLDWLIFVTNVPASMLTMEQVALLYRVRWQIELVFKLWKSYAGLKRIAGLRRERVLYELYAKMIGLLLTQFLLAPWRMPHGHLANRELSLFKVRDILQDFARELMRALPVLANLMAVLTTILRRMERFGFKQKRKKQPNLCHALALASTLYVLEIDLEQDIELPIL